MLFLDGFSPETEGPTLTLNIRKGTVVAVIGPTGSGTERFIRGMIGKERPGQGSGTLAGSTSLAGEPPIARRTKVQNLGRQGGGADRLTRATELLLALRLHERRQMLFGELEPAEQAAAELLEVISAAPDVIAITGHLDRLDPWALRGAMEKLREQVQAGCCLLISTIRVDIAEIADIVVVLNQGRLRFAGTKEDLLRLGPRHHLTVGTSDNPGVRALVAPFRVDVEDENGVLNMHAEEGQELAAKLLLEGYGDVSFVIHRAPTLQEAIFRLI